MLNNNRGNYMSLMILIMLFFLFLALVFIVIGVTIYRKRKRNNVSNKPTLLGISAIIFQILLIIFFLSEVLANMNEKIADVLWWAVILYGIVTGIKEFKKNIFVSLLSIYISILLAVLMGLTIFIAAM